MEKPDANTAARSKADRQRIQMSLERSIEAHRLRMLKARSSKLDARGSLCECINCDATSMKPSMTCRKAGKQKQQRDVNKERVGGFIHDVSPVSSLVNAPPSRRQYSYNVSLRNGNVATPKVNSYASGSKRSSRTEVPRKVPNVVEMSHAKAMDAREDSVVPSTAREVAVNEANVYKNDAEIVTSAREGDMLPVNDDESSTTLRESARQECGGASSRTDENSDSLLNRIARRLGSIRIVDSMGEEHRIDTNELENRILDVVDKIVNDKLASKNTEEKLVNNENTDTQMADGDINATVVPIDRCSPKNDVPDMTKVESEETVPSPKREEFGVEEETDNVSMNKYKNVVDVLLDYISCGVAQKPKATPDVLKQESYILADADSLRMNQVVSKTPDYVDPTVEKTSLLTSVFFRGEAGKRSNACCNGGEERHVPSGPHSVFMNDTVSNSGDFGFIKPSHAAFRKEAMSVAPSRQMSQASAIRHDGPFMNVAPNWNHGVQYVNHANMMMNGHSPYHFQHIPPQFACNQNAVYPPQWPVVQNYQNQCHLIAPAPKMTDRQFTAPSRRQSLVRRNITAVPGVNAINKPQRAFGSMQNVAGVPFAAYNRPRRAATANRSPMPFGGMASPMVAVQRQATGVLYRRNTGRAHEQQVQAAMI
ncbi:hypothetical protein, conserved [Babesia ovata]|uniref:Uncharacterized protein n=1 Tax=Babesia ovata TaxID=189622 RepID=A0A2H6KIA2_9APIC|nr:uncharacterized protein BOVATA_042130 [Babesia ovata]GBE62720.1 hypothetical protein, conserved [Babesia ovata]